MALYCQITGRDGQITDIPTESASVFMFVHRHVSITFFCGGDLSSVGVYLEQGSALSAGGLTDQAVHQMSVWSFGVVLIRRRYAGKRDTWSNR